MGCAWQPALEFGYHWAEGELCQHDAQLHGDEDSSVVVEATTCYQVGCDISACSCNSAIVHLSMNRCCCFQPTKESQPMPVSNACAVPWKCCTALWCWCHGSLWSLSHDQSADLQHQVQSADTACVHSLRDLITDKGNSLRPAPSAGQEWSRRAHRQKGRAKATLPHQIQCNTSLSCDDVHNGPDQAAGPYSGGAWGSTGRPQTLKSAK